MGLVGRLEDLALPEIFSLLSLSRKTGKLVVRRKEETAAVIFSSGQVVQAATTSLRESIGHLLLLRKVISENELKAALEIQKCSPRKKRLGAILLEKGFITQEVLENTIKSQIEEIIFEILNWKEGLFNFELGDTNIGDEIGVDTQEFLLRSGIKPEYLIMEGTRLFDEKRKAAVEMPVIPLVPPQDLEGIRDTLKEVEPEKSPPAFAVEDKVVKELESPGVQSVELKDLGLPAESAAVEESSPPQTPRPAPPKGVSASEITALRSMFMELRLRSLNGEITLLIMRYASESTDRGILLMVKGDYIRGLGQFGMEIGGASADQQVRNIRIPVKQPSVFSWSLELAQTYKGEMPPSSWNDYLANLTGGKYPHEVLIIPMVVEKEVVAVIYGDNLTTGRPIENVESLEIFINQAGLAMEKALLEHRIQELQKK